MLKNIKNTILIALATLGVLFIVLMLMPEDDETTEAAENTSGTEAALSESSIIETQTTAASGNTAAETTTSSGNASTETAASVTSNNTANTVTVTIPEDEKSKDVLEFRTVSLDNKVVTQDIFSDYDITVVHIWGTFCRPCIAEMGDYANFYKERPGNVNLVGLMCDVYDGIESNVSDAKDILGDADAGFLNIRTSDDLYDVIDDIQYVPSSFFVDREGHIIGEILDGASYNDTMKKLDEYLK